MKPTIFLSCTILGITLLCGQEISKTINKTGEKPAMALPDLRGAGDAQNFMLPFNGTLWN